MFGQLCLSIDDLGNNLKDLAAKYGKEVMVVEVGGEDTKPQNTYDMLLAAQNKVKAVQNNYGLGLFYWEPQGARSWSRYGLSAWGSNGRPTHAMNAFKDFVSALANPAETKLRMHQDKQNKTLFFNEEMAKIEIVTLNGMMIKSVGKSNSISTGNLPKGSYLIRTKRTHTNISSVYKFIRN